VSRIFDALQRLESERSGDDASALPQGPELLRRAERRAAEKWEVAGSDAGVDLVERSEEDEPGPAAAEFQVSNGKPALSIAQGNARVAGSELLEKSPSLKMSLAQQSRLVCVTDRESPTAEAIRLLGVRLRDLRQIRPLKTMLITSTIPQEGKSTISANLACALAQASGEKVLLLEGDLRRPSLLQIFGTEATSGIADCVKDGGRKLAGIYRLEDAGCWILPCGRAPGNPLELLQSDGLKALTERLTALFDWIVIDSPPVLPLADTSIWMRMADGVLLVTREGTTQKRQLEKGLEALDKHKLLGALVNGAVASEYSGYYDSPSIAS
jgi:capsular exopolysaccharide synthesis family protein